jgi:alanyl-tRNA synthetase
MPTKRLYYFDTELFEHVATVTGVEENIVELDETIFHPQGGGQPSDVGTINDIQVAKVTDRGEEFAIQHELNSAPDFKVGDKVTLKVESEPRLLFSRLHSAGHFLAHVAEKTYPNLSNARGHHFPGEARVQFDYTGELPTKEEMSKTLLANMVATIKNNSTVVSEWTPENGRTISMSDVGKVPCGGTHVKSLQDISTVTFRKIEAKKGTLKLSYNV